MLYTLWHNLRYAVRRLAERPGFTAVAVGSLALGIGANTALFTLVHAVLLQELPLESPEELVEVYLSTPDFDYGVLSYPDLRDLRDGTTEVFSEVSGTRLILAHVERGSEIELLPAEAVTGNYFTTLGIEAAVGRTLLPEDDVYPGAHPVVVLGHGYWQSAFGGDPGVVGTELRLGGLPYTIVGVAPEGYPGHFRGLVPALFAPRMMINQLAPGSTDELEARGNHAVFVTARLAPDVTMAEAGTAVDAVATRLREQDFEDWDPQAGFLLVPTTDVILYPPFDRFIQQAAWLLMVVVALVLLVACVNLASFLLARAVDRRREIAVCLALGATRRHLVMQLLTETVLLALAGGACGVLVAGGLLRLLTGVDLPLPLPINLDLELDRTVLGFSLFVSLGAGILLGLAPAFASTRTAVSSTIREESAFVGRSRKLSLRSALVVLQVAVSLVLLVTAGLFLRSLQRVQTVDPGFGHEPAAILSILVPSTHYDQEAGRRVVRRLEERLLELPGVEAVGVTNNLHLNTLAVRNMRINVDGVEPPPGQESHTVDQASVSPGFFDAVGIEILRGRHFDTNDGPGAPQVAIVNQAMAERFWPGEDPLGRLVRRPDDEDLLVVGIASDAKVRSLGESPRPFVYRPYGQSYTSFLTVVARTSLDAEQTALDLFRAAREFDRELWIWETKTMEQHLGVVLLPARLAALVLSAFSTLALALASMGLYGVVSYAVSRRTREVGIRMSLGADRGRLIRMLMAAGLKLVVIGGALGLTLALVAAPVLASLLVGIRPLDVVAFTAMPLVLGLVAVLAVYVPARHASRIDPVRALRLE